MSLLRGRFRARWHCTWLLFHHIARTGILRRADIRKWSRGNSWAMSVRSAQLCSRLSIWLLRKVGVLQLFYPPFLICVALFVFVYFRYAMQEQICFYSQHFAIPICLVGNVNIPKSHPSCFFYENVTRYYFPFYTLVQLHVCLHFVNWLCSQSDLKCSDFRVTWQTGSMITSLRWWLKPPLLVDQNITETRKKVIIYLCPTLWASFETSFLSDPGLNVIWLDWCCGQTKPAGTSKLKSAWVNETSVWLILLNWSLVDNCYFKAKFGCIGEAKKYRI